MELQLGMGRHDSRRRWRKNGCDTRRERETEREEERERGGREESEGSCIVDHRRNVSGATSEASSLLLKPARSVKKRHTNDELRERWLPI